MLQATKCPNCDEEAIHFTAIDVISCGHCEYREERQCIVNHGETREQEMQKLLTGQKPKDN